MTAAVARPLKPREVDTLRHSIRHYGADELVPRLLATIDALTPPAATEPPIPAPQRVMPRPCTPDTARATLAHLTNTVPCGLQRLADLWCSRIPATTHDMATEIINRYQTTATIQSRRNGDGVVIAPVPTLAQPESDMR